MTNISKKVLSLAITLIMVFLAYTPVNAAMLYNAKVTLSNPKASGSSNYAFNMKVKTAGTVKGIKIAILKSPSGSAQNPTSFDPSGTTLNESLTGLAAGWTLDKTTDAATDILYLTKAAGDELAADTTVGWQIDGAGNPPIVNGANTGCQQNTTNASAGTCYIKIITFNTETVATMQAETAGNILDQTVIGFTVVSGTSVSATVDPTLAFTVVGVNSGTDINDAGAVTTASVTSSFDTITFGNLTVGTPKTAAHNLYVKTNAQNGYAVTIKSTTDTVDEDGVLQGQYSGNNIDGYEGDATWTTPVAWASPDSTTANTDSGVFGVNSHDTDTVFTGANANNWAAVQNETYRTIMSSTGPDLGTAATLISFAIEVNVYQPADTYTGTFLYNCVPTY